MRVAAKQNGINDKSSERKKIQLLYTAIIFLTIIGLTIVFFLVSIEPGTGRSSSPKTRQMKRMAAKIGKLEAEVQMKQNELISLLKVYSQETGEPLPVLNGLGLSDDERKILEDKITNEKDISIKSLLKDILDKNNEIYRLKIETGKYEALIPKPHIAAEGESHYQIVMEFLTNEKKVKKERALRLVENAVLFDPLIPGFRVWNFYSGDEFGTFVTQGSADISPTELRRTPEKYRGDISNSNIDEKERLDAEINKLKLTKDQLELKIRSLRDEDQKLERKLNGLYEQNLEMERLLHSLSYMVDLEKNLKKEGILKKVFLRSTELKQILPEDFDQKIDLRKEEIIEIYANQFNLDEIKKVTLYPGFYKQGVDYKVEIVENNQKAIVTILAVEKFRRERVVISVE